MWLTRKHFIVAGSLFLFLTVLPLPVSAVTPVEVATAEASFVPPPGQGIPADYRKSWRRLSNIAVSGLHWQQWVVVYSNQGGAVYRHNRDIVWAQQQGSGWSDVEPAKELGYQSFKPGTILIKEGFIGTAVGLRPDFLAIMIKRQPGFDAKHGDWEYIRSDPRGKVIMQGPLTSRQMGDACGNCHNNVQDRDFVFATTGLGAR